MQITKKFFGIFASLSLVGSAFAVPFDTTTSNGTATVGSGGDYATLYDAADAFNALGSSLQGDWKLEILNDLTEPVNVGFGNEIPNGSLTIKPAAETSVTLTFTATADNASGPSGYFQIGITNAMAWTDLRKTTNITIDGSNNGTDSRNLTVTNTPDATHNFTMPISLNGDIDNITVKNTSVHNISVPSGSGASNSGITLTARYDGAGPHFVPNNIKIDNNEILVRNSDQAHGLNFRTSSVNTPSGLTSVGYFEVTNNTIEAALRGIFLNNGMNGLIDNNVVRLGVDRAIGGYVHPAIWVNGVGETVEQTLTISNNEVYIRDYNANAGDYGPTGIYLTNAPNRTFNVVNNMINFEFMNSAPNTESFTYAGMRLTSGATYNILHNSINLPAFENLGGLTPTSTAASVIAAGGIRLPGVLTYTANIQNNIIRAAQPGTAAIIIPTDTVPDSLTLDNNVLFQGEGAFTGVLGVPANSPAPIVALADWQTATNRDLASVAVDPTATTGSAWAPASDNADLRFVPATAVPAEIPTFALVGDVTTDIDGEARAPQTLPGADEVLASTVNDWSVY